MAEIDNTEIKPKKKGGLKFLIYGIPLFILQLVAVYYITATLLIKKFESQAGSGTGNVETVSEEKEHEAAEGTHELGKFIYSIEDIIVNPAGTDGKRLLLTSVGLDIPDETQMAELEEKEILVKDVIISILSNKTLGDLRNAAYKDSLRVEISDNLQENIPGININKVYFSKYILQ